MAVRSKLKILGNVPLDVQVGLRIRSMVPAEMWDRASWTLRGKGPKDWI
jgi:hypothetical protein